MRIKAKPLAPTGHFKSTTHSYFPGLPGAKIVVTESGAEVLLERTLRDYDPEERKLRRKELAELGEALAKVDRRVKRG
jgi:predicted mannosyl-3-phosphoglycerate phosphatase (HAD superfamily)